MIHDGRFNYIRTLPTPFATFNPEEWRAGITSGFRLFIGGGLRGAECLPEGEGIASGEASRVSGSGRVFYGEAVSCVPSGLPRMGCGTGGPSYVGGVPFEPD